MTAIAAGVGFGLAALGCYAPGVPLCLALAGLHADRNVQTDERDDS